MIEGWASMADLRLQKGINVPTARTRRLGFVRKIATRAWLAPHILHAGYARYFLGELYEN